METQAARPLGRSLRGLVGVCVMILALPVYFRAGWAYDMRSLGIVVALAAFYTVVHLVSGSDVI